jgi:hypothetical protein
MLELLDPQVEWRAPESLPWGGTFRGHEGFREFFAIVVDQIAEFRRERQQYLEAGDRVVVLLRSIGRPKGGTEFDVPEVHVCTVRHGRIVALDTGRGGARRRRAHPWQGGRQDRVTSANIPRWPPVMVRGRSLNQETRPHFTVSP